MQYEPYIPMRVSVTDWNPPSNLAASKNGYIQEPTEGPFWIATTNPREVAQAILSLDTTTTLDVSSVSGHPSRATSFTVKYSRLDRWTALTASVKVLQTIEAVNVPPKEVKPIRYPTRPLRPTAYPAGYTRS